MNDFAKLFDPYDREAHLYPVVLLLAPALFLVLVAYPKVLLGPLPENVVVAIFFFAAAYVLSGLTRNAGKSAQSGLYDAWNGAPTTTMLRHRDSSLDRGTKTRYHNALKQMCTGIRWPSASDEAIDPILADAAYASAVDILRARRRGNAYSLVLKENAQYGFRRNMYGLRDSAIVLALLVAAIASGLFFAQLHAFPWNALHVRTNDYSSKLLIVVLAAVAAALLWFFSVRRSWVEKAARDYARALLATLDTQDRR